MLELVATRPCLNLMSDEERSRVQLWIDSEPSDRFALMNPTALCLGREGGGYNHVLLLFVHPAHRRRGLGSKMLQGLVPWNACASRADVLPFYRKVGCRLFHMPPRFGRCWMVAKDLPPEILDMYKGIREMSEEEADEMV